MMDAGWPVSAFGDPDQAIWGVLIGGPEPRIAIGGPVDGSADLTVASFAPAIFEPAAIEHEAATASWLVSSPRATLRLEGVAPAPGELTSCEVSGEFARGDDNRDGDGDGDGDTGGAHALAARGVRCDQLPSRKVGSIRFVSSWFAAGHGIALLAARPERATGQDRDELATAIAGEPAGKRVFDSRLSTTYALGGVPRRAGLELWLGESEDGDQYPRRVAGTIAGPAAVEILSGTRIAAFPMRCQSRGDDGLGVYVLLTAA